MRSEKTSKQKPRVERAPNMFYGKWQRKPK